MFRTEVERRQDTYARTRTHVRSPAFLLFLKPIVAFLWLRRRCLPSHERCRVDATTHPQSYSHLSSTTLGTVYTHQTSSERLQTPPSVSTSTATPGTGTRQTPRVSSATTPFASLDLIIDPPQLKTEIHRCPISGKDQRAHQCRQIFHRPRAPEECPRGRVCT